MDNQTAFNKMVRHLRKQNAKALAGDDQAVCRYRAESGLMCAVGCLIPKKLYMPALEGRPAREILTSQHEVFKDLQQFFTGVDHELLKRMQTVHDVYEVNDWEHLFRDIALSFKLDLPAQET